GDGHLPALTILIALQWMGGVVLDRPAHSGRWIDPAVAIKRVAAVGPYAHPGPGGWVRGELRDFCNGLSKGAAIGTSRYAGANGKSSDPLHAAGASTTNALREQ